jgi:micrococcal nuclease
MRRIVLVAVAGLTLAGCRGDGDDTADAAPPANGAVIANATVARVVDGDTLDVSIDGREERVRMIGIDTPEVAHDGSPERPGNPAECFGPEATAFTAGLVAPGTAVRLERDVVGRDDYGRVLAYVYRASDGIFVNYELVRQGYAQPLTIRPNVSYSDHFVDAARRAEADDAGLWSSCS